MNDLLDLLRAGLYTQAAEKVYLHPDKSVASVYIRIQETFGSHTREIFELAVKQLRENNHDLYIKAVSEEPAKRLLELLKEGKWEDAGNWLSTQLREYHELMYAHVFITFGASSVRLLSQAVAKIREDREKQQMAEIAARKLAEKNSIKGKKIVDFEEQGPQKLVLTMDDGSQYYFIGTCASYHEDGPDEQVRWGLQHDSHS